MQWRRKEKEGVPQTADHVHFHCAGRRECAYSATDKMTVSSSNTEPSSGGAWLTCGPVSAQRQEDEASKDGLL